jgi:ABC-type nitrate/sulfonate/bicarbonate transport system substrate-binding protein
MKNNLWLLIIVISLGIIIFAGSILLFAFNSSAGFFNLLEKVSLGTAPFPSSILPPLIEKKGWDKKERIKIRTHFYPEKDLASILLSGKTEVAIMDFFRFQSVFAQAKNNGKEIIFYCPLYIDKGDAILARSDSKIKSFAEIIKEMPEINIARKTTLKQLKGKTITTTKGSAAEQLLQLALEQAGIKSSEVKMVYASPDRCLAAFLKGDADVIAGDLSVQLAARKENHRPLIFTSDLGLVSIYGLVSTKNYADKHPATMESLVNLWFRAAQNIKEDPRKRTKALTKELSRRTQRKYSGDDMVYIFETAGIFPESPQAAADLLLSHFSPYYWQKVWGQNNQYLSKRGTINQPVPYEAFGEKNLPAVIIRQ